MDVKDCGSGEAGGPVEFEQLKMTYAKLLEQAGKGPFENEYIDHENEG